MSHRLAFWIILPILISGCGQGSSPSSTSPSSISSPSPNPSPPCAFTLSVGATIDGYPNGGSFSVSVTTAPVSGCNWTATSQASWIHIPVNVAAGGPGSFTFSVDPNPGPVRAGTLTVAGKIVAFNQSSSTSPCTYRLSVGSTINGYPAGSVFRVTVTTKPSTRCGWTAVSNADWIHITSGASGGGSGAFTFAVDANTGSARVGTLAAAGEIVLFNQSSEGGP